MGKTAKITFKEFSKNFEGDHHLRIGCHLAFKQWATIFLAGSPFFNSAITKFYESVEILENTGVMIKSIEQGLLDFPSKRFDEEVWLCWKDGETEIKFWHEIDSGFNGRKPVTISDESLV